MGFFTNTKHNPVSGIVTLERRGTHTVLKEGAPAFMNKPHAESAWGLTLGSRGAVRAVLNGQFFGLPAFMNNPCEREIQEEYRKVNAADQEVSTNGLC